MTSDPDDPEMTWQVEEFGGGVMIREPRDPNPALIRAVRLDECEDLQCVASAATR